MHDVQTAIILLSVIVGLLSILIIVLFGVVIALLLKLRKIAQRIESITVNVERATEWLSPTKVFSEISNLFRRK